MRFGCSLLEKVGGATQLDAKSVRRLDHLRLRAAPSVTPPEQVQGAIRAGRVLEVTDAPLDLFGGEAAVVRIRGREVGEDARPVDAFPDEGVVLRLVGVVPGELLGQEEVAARLRHQLRQVARVAEDVGQPQDLRLIAELAHEEPLAMQQLPHERLAGRQVAVRLDPHRTDRLPTTGDDLLSDASIDVGVRLLDPLVLRRLGGGEDVVGVLVHQCELRRPAAGDLSLRLAERPLPRRVDMRVADRGDPVREVDPAVGRRRVFEYGKHRFA